MVDQMDRPLNEGSQAPDSIVFGPVQFLPHLTLEPEKVTTPPRDSSPSSTAAVIPSRVFVAPAQKLKGWRLVVVEIW